MTRLESPTKQPIVKPETTDLKSFNEIWYQIFLYCLATTVLIYCIAALISFRSLHKHKYGRYFSIVLIVAGFLYPLTGGIITSCMIAWVYSASDYGMPKYFAFFYGFGQAFLLLLVSFARIYGTL